MTRPQITVHHEAPPQDGTKYDAVRVTNVTEFMLELQRKNVHECWYYQHGDDKFVIWKTAVGATNEVV